MNDPGEILLFQNRGRADAPVGLSTSRRGGGQKTLERRVEVSPLN